ncbi:MAG: hypothetical protein ACR2QH_05990 [Geminicoccaceae bacterium]
MKFFPSFAFLQSMFDHTDSIDWPALVRPYGQAERALGELAFALESTRLHPTFLWRELTRIAAIIAQIRGYRVQAGQLRLVLIGAPVDADDNTSGLAAAKRIFLAAEPLFRAGAETESRLALLPAFWHDGGNEPPQAGSDALTGHHDQRRAGQGARPQRVARPQQEAGPQQGEREQLLGLVKELAGFADDGRRPALINLLVDLRKHAARPAAKRLPTPLVRIALPLTLVEAGLVPKAAPGLLGGVRLPLGMSRATVLDQPITDWLKGGLGALAAEAEESRRRLAELTRQHQAWHQALAKTGLRKHAKAPLALDLLAATPVLTIGLVARHLGCSHVAAGKIAERLVDLGILIEPSSRSRHKLFVAGDLPVESRGDTDASPPLSLSEPTPLVDVDAVRATLDGLFADLERLNERAEGQVRAGD